MNAHFFDFAKQNQKNGHSFKIFLGGVSRQGSFETGSTRRACGPPSALSGSRAAPEEPAARAFYTTPRSAVRSGAPPTALDGKQAAYARGWLNSYKKPLFSTVLIVLKLATLPCTALKRARGAAPRLSQKTFAACGGERK